MNETTHHAIEAAALEHDLDALADLLIEHERDDDARYVIYEAIDTTAAHLDVLVTTDVFYMN